jgi:hypothetical protein
VLFVSSLGAGDNEELRTQTDRERDPFLYLQRDLYTVIPFTVQSKGSPRLIGLGTCRHPMIPGQGMGPQGWSGSRSLRGALGSSRACRG